MILVLRTSWLVVALLGLTIPAAAHGLVDETEPASSTTPATPPSDSCSQGNNGCALNPDCKATGEAACKTECCNECFEGCEECCVPKCWVVGTEFTFLAPSFRGSGLSTSLTDGGATTFNDGSRGSFNNMTFAPRISIGAQGPCWGWMTRFWYLSDSSGFNTPFDPSGANRALNGFNRLNAYTYDLEAVRQWIGPNCGRVYLTGGVRYASLNADGALNSTAFLNGTDLTSAFATSSAQFNGTGLTSAFYGTVPVCCGSCLNYFWSVRNSVLWGGSKSAVTTGTGIISTLGDTGTVNSSGAGTINAMYIGEVQAGLQWQQQLQCCPCSAFFRVAAEYQYWRGGNTFSNSSSASFLNSGASSAANAGDINLSFVGLGVATGFIW